MTNRRLAASLEALRWLSATIGSVPHLIQGAGGNVSVKSDDTMWIKASGTWLAEAMNRDIMVPVVLPAAVDGSFAVAECDTTGLRPSIETSMHATLPHAVVLHVHSVDTIAIAVRADADAILAERLAGLRWVFVPYRRPGAPLTEAIRAVTQGNTADVLVLANHGLVVAGDDVAATAALLDDVVERLAQPVRSALPASSPAPPTSGLGYRLPRHASAHAIATDPISLAIAERGTLYPDHVVFLGKAPLTVDDVAEVASALGRVDAAGEPRPRWVIVRGQGVLVADDIARGGDEMLQCLADVAARIPAGAPLRFLSEPDIAALVDWDAEKYRQRLARIAA